MAYISLADFKLYVRNELGSTDDVMLQAGLNAAEAAINEMCGRSFDVAGAASVRVFVPESEQLVIIDDATTVTLVQENDATVDASGYQLEPLNGRRRSGKVVPYDQIRRIYGTWYQDPERRASLSITGTWGWAATPAEVIEATKILAKDILHQRDNRSGVAGFGEFGSVRVRQNPYVVELVSPYVKAGTSMVDFIGVY